MLSARFAESRSCLTTGCDVSHITLEMLVFQSSSSGPIGTSALGTMEESLARLKCLMSCFANRAQKEASDDATWHIERPL